MIIPASRNLRPRILDVLDLVLIANFCPRLTWRLFNLRSPR